MPDLYQELCKLADSDMYPFHMPGHKRNLEGTPMKGAFRCDITEIDNFDNLHDASGIILDAQKRANELYGADETFFLVNGSTSGVLSALSAVVGENQTVLAARGSHKSFYHAVYLRHLNVQYLPYKIDARYDIPDVYSARDIEMALRGIDNADDIKAVFITSPTYEGKCSDIRGIAEVCHRYRIPLIVDAAHGAHFFSRKRVQEASDSLSNVYKYESPTNAPEDEDKVRKAYSDEFGGDGTYQYFDCRYISTPENAVSQGADIVIHSVHKTLPSMTQTALLHVQGDLVDRGRLKRFLRIYQSSSPSYVLMSSIDLCVKEMMENKEAYIEKLLEYRNRIQDGTAKCRYIEVPGKDVIADAAKILISVKNATMTGQELYDILREEYKLQLEMAGETYVLAIITGWDKEEGIDRLIKAICEIDLRIADKTSKAQDNCSDGQCMTEVNSKDNESVESKHGNISQKEMKASDDENINVERASSVSVMELPQKRLSLSEAWDAECEKVSIFEAEGRIAGEFINLYPPGIPIIVPGEVISEGVIAKMDSFLKDGLNVQGIDDRKEVICVRQK